MTFEQRITAARILASTDGIVCVVANGQAALVCGLDSATEAEIMTSLASMYNAVVHCTNNIYNSLNATKFDRDQTKTLLDTLATDAVRHQYTDIRLRRTGE